MKYPTIDGTTIEFEVKMFRGRWYINIAPKGGVWWHLLPKDWSPDDK